MLVVLPSPLGKSLGGHMSWTLADQLCIHCLGDMCSIILLGVHICLHMLTHGCAWESKEDIGFLADAKQQCRLAALSWLVTCMKGLSLAVQYARPS